MNRLLLLESLKKKETRSLCSVSASKHVYNLLVTLGAYKSGEEAVLARRLRDVLCCDVEQQRIISDRLDART